MKDSDVTDKSRNKIKGALYIRGHKAAPFRAWMERGHSVFRSGKPRALACGALLLILVLAALLRIHNLGKVPFWGDELLTYDRCNMPILDMLKGLSSHPIFPPLYYLLTNAWVKVFGITEFTLRFSSVIFSVFSVFFVYELGKALYGRQVGLFAALLLSFSPYSVYYAQEAKMYSMSWALGTASFWLFYRLMTQWRRIDSIAYVLVTAACWYTSYLGLLYSFIQGVAFFILSQTETAGFSPRRFIFRTPKILCKWARINFFVLVLFSPWLGKFFWQIAHHEQMRWVHATENYFIKALQNICEIQLLPYNAPCTRLNVVIYIVILIFAFTKFKKSAPFQLTSDIHSKDVFLIVWFFSPFPAYYLIEKFWGPIFQVPRYFGFIHIPFFLLLAKWIGRLRFRLRTITISLFICYMYFFGLGPYYEKAKKFTGQDWRRVFSSIEETLAPKSLVVTFLPERSLAYYSHNFDLVSASQEGYAYAKEEFGSIFVVHSPKHKYDVYLPAYSVFSKWQIDGLYVVWYKRIRDNQNEENINAK